MTFGDYIRVCYGQIRKDEKQWLHTRKLIALLININRAKGKAVVRPEDIYKTSYDITIKDTETERKLAVIDKLKANFEKNKKAWLQSK